MPEDHAVDEETARGARELVDALARLSANDPLRITVFEGKAPDFRGFRLALTDQLSSLFRARVIAFAQRLQSNLLVSFTPTRPHTDGSASYVPSHQLPVAHVILEQLANPLNLVPFTPSVMEQVRPRFYVVSVGTQNHRTTVHLVRHLDASYRLDRSRWVRLVWRNNVYDELEEEPLLFSDDFDSILTAHLSIIIKQRGTDAVFGVVAEVRERAREILQQVTSKLRIKNFDPFAKAVLSDQNMLSRLRSIEVLAEDERYQQSMTMENIIALAHERPDLHLDVEGPDGSEELVFHPDPRRRWRLLQLLDDSFVRSLITSIEYGANSKEPLT